MGLQVYYECGSYDKLLRWVVNKFVNIFKVLLVLLILEKISLHLVRIFSLIGISRISTSTTYQKENISFILNSNSSDSGLFVAKFSIYLIINFPSSLVVITKSYPSQ